MEKKDEKRVQGEAKAKVGFESLAILRSRLKDGTFSEILDDWKWIFRYSLRYKWAIVIYVILGIVSTSLGLASSVAGKYLIDIITEFRYEQLTLLVVIMVGGMVSSLLFDSLVNRISVKLSIYINNDIQADIFDKIMDADWMAISKFSNGDVLNRFNGDISTISNCAINWLPQIVIIAYRFLATFVVLMHYDFVMALIAFASAPFMLVASKYLIQNQRMYNKKVREVSSELMTFEVEAFYNQDTIKSYGVSSLYGEKMRTWQEKFRDISLQYNWFTIKTNVFMTLLGSMVQFLAFGYCLFRLWTKDITYGTMTLFLQQRTNLSNSFQSFVSIIPNFLNGSVSAHRIRELVELPREVHISESHALDAYRAEGFQVCMKDASFSYKEGEVVVKDSSFMAAPGEIIALVGPSGEGKTTMIRLILGLIRPEKGQVFLRAAGKSGVEIEMNAETRHLFSYVPQGNTIFSGSIADNMRIAKADATDEELIAALKVACAWEFVEKMPGQLQAKIGERGRGCSEGQAQRIAIARAILRDAPILLLDEATSALDVATERRILKNLVDSQSNKTCIVTTHRPSVLNLCKRVYRVVDTKVTELSEEESSKMAMDF